MNFKCKRINHQHYEIHIKLDIHLEEGNTNHNIGTHREMNFFREHIYSGSTAFPKGGYSPPPHMHPSVPRHRSRPLMIISSTAHPAAGPFPPPSPLVGSLGSGFYCFLSLPWGGGGFQNI